MLKTTYKHDNTRATQFVSNVVANFYYSIYLKITKCTCTNYAIVIFRLEIVTCRAIPKAIGQFSIDLLHIVY